MLATLQNPYFYGLVISLIAILSYVLRHQESIPAFIFLLFSSLAWFYKISGIEEVSQLKAILFLMFLLVLFIRKLKRHEKIPIISNLLLFIYLSTVMFSLVINGGDLNLYRAYFGVLLVPTVISLCPENDKTVRYLTIAMALFGAANLIAVLFELAGLGWAEAYADGRAAAQSYRVLGLAGQGTMQGIYLVISLNAVHVLFIQAKSRVVQSMLILLGVALAVALFGTLSRGAIAGWVLSFLFIQNRLSGLRFGPLAVAAILLLVIVGVADILGIADLVAERFVTIRHESSALERLTLLDLGYRLFLTSPVFGVGLGQGGLPHLEAHNTYLQILMETGIFGFAMFLAILVRGIWGLMLRAESGSAETRNPYYVGLLGTLAAILVDGTFHVFDYFMPMWLIIGIGFQVVTWRASVSVSSH